MILLAPDAVEDVERLRTFLDQNNPGAAQRALESIWTAIERLQEFPEMGMQTEDAGIRQIVVRFGSSDTSYVMLSCPATMIFSSHGYGTAARQGSEAFRSPGPWYSGASFVLSAITGWSSEV